MDLERKERTELEKKALDLIKSAKLKWETSEKSKVEALKLELEQQKVKITELTTTNKMLNEQLQHALKLENKHKESLEKVELLSRRSVIGLESRLGRVTSETQGTITDLQKKLTEEIHQRNLIENKLSDVKEKERSLKEKLKNSEKDFDYWKSKIEEAESQVRSLNEQVTGLEKDVEKIDEYKNEISRLKDKLDKGHRAIKDLENRNILLQRDSQSMEGYKKEIEEMKKTILKMQNDRKISDLESQLMEEKEKSLSLQKQLQVRMI